MQQFYVNILDSGLEYCALWYLYYAVCGTKETNNIKKMLIAVGTICGFCWLSLYIDNYILKCTGYAVIGLLPAFLFNGKWHIKGILSLVESIIQFAGELVVVGLLSEIYNFTTLPLSIGLYTMSVVYSRLCGFFTTVLFSQMLKKRLMLFYKISAKKMLFLVGLIMGSIFVLNTLFHEMMDQANDSEFVTFFCSICVVCVLNLYLLFNEFEVIEKKLLEQKITYVEKMQKIQEENWKKISEKTSKLWILAHDVKNFLLLIQGQLLRQETDQAQIELNKYLGQFKEVQCINSGILMLDTVIAAKEELAKEHDIHFQCAVFLEEELKINPVDIAMAIANAADNAIEAASKIMNPFQRSVIVEVKTISGYLHILVENTIAEPVIIKENNIDTTKNSKELHGFGLKSIEMLTSKYHGKMILHSANGRFCITMVFKNEQIDE